MCLFKKRRVLRVANYMPCSTTLWISHWSAQLTEQYCVWHARGVKKELRFSFRLFLSALPLIDFWSFHYWLWSGLWTVRNVTQITRWTICTSVKCKPCELLSGQTVSQWLQDLSNKDQKHVCAENHLLTISLCECAAMHYRTTLTNHLMQQ